MLSHSSTFVHLTFAALALVAAGCDAAAAPNDRAGAPAPAADKTGFAVVELFTSEGCSSCPPADKLLADLAAEARRAGKPIYFLAFHVDYWNNLGWTDPFSDAAYSQRQRDCAAAFKTDSIYTPQMIVNGRTEFVGSDRATATRAIQAALAKPAACAIDLKSTFDAKSKTVTIDYKINNAPANSKLNLALVESGLSTNVPRGENAGRTLPHSKVVRAFKTVDVPAGGAGRIPLPIGPTMNLDQAEVVAYVQSIDRTTLSAGVVKPRQ